MFNKEEIERLQERCEKLENRVTDLCKLLGFATYPNGNWVRTSSLAMGTTDLCHSEKSKQPVTQKQLQLLLDHLGLEVVEKPTIPAETVIRKKMSLVGSIGGITVYASNTVPKGKKGKAKKSN